MCRFQKEINSKIQEKKALEIPAEPAEGGGCSPGSSCDRTSGVRHQLDEDPDGADGSTHSLEEGSSDAEEQYHYGEESVGTARQHDF